MSWEKKENSSQTPWESSTPESSEWEENQVEATSWSQADALGPSVWIEDPCQPGTIWQFDNVVPLTGFLGLGEELQNQPDQRNFSRAYGDEIAPSGELGIESIDFDVEGPVELSELWEQTQTARTDEEQTYFDELLPSGSVTILTFESFAFSGSIILDETFVQEEEERLQFYSTADELLPGGVFSLVEEQYDIDLGSGSLLLDEDYLQEESERLIYFSVADELLPSGVFSVIDASRFIWLSGGLDLSELIEQNAEERVVEEAWIEDVTPSGALSVSAQNDIELLGSLSLSELWLQEAQARLVERDQEDNLDLTGTLLYEEQASVGFNGSLNLSELWDQTSQARANQVSIADNLTPSGSISYLELEFAVMVSGAGSLGESLSREVTSRILNPSSVEDNLEPGGVLSIQEQGLLISLGGFVSLEESNALDQTSTTPPVPSNINLFVFGPSLALTWTGSSEAASYDWEFRESSGGALVGFGSVNHPTQSVQWFGGEGNVFYQARVRARNSAGSSNFSAWSESVRFPITGGGGPLL